MCPNPDISNLFISKAHWKGIYKAGISLLGPYFTTIILITFKTDTILEFGRDMLHKIMFLNVQKYSPAVKRQEEKEQISPCLQLNAKLVVQAEY